LRKLDCTALQIGGTSNHMHILCIKHRTITEAKVVEEIKKNNALHYIKALKGRKKFQTIIKT
jgi:hypothetical protein